MSQAAGVLTPMLPAMPPGGIPGGAPRPQLPPTEDRETKIWADQGKASGPDMPHARLLKQWIDSPNIAAIEGEGGIPQSVLDKAAQDVVHEFDIDWQSCSDFREKYEKWMNMALQVAENKTFPWNGACYSLDTDVLTERGWIPVGDVVAEDLVLWTCRWCGRVLPGHSCFSASRAGDGALQGKEHRPARNPKSPHGGRGQRPTATGAYFVEARRFFLVPGLTNCYIPLTSRWAGERPLTIHGIPAVAYLRFLGWYIAEGSAFTGRNVHTCHDGLVIDYGASTTSFAISQSRAANPEKYRQVGRDLTHLRVRLLGNRRRLHRARQIDAGGRQSGAEVARHRLAQACSPASDGSGWVAS